MVPRRRLPRRSTPALWPSQRVRRSTQLRSRRDIQTATSLQLRTTSRLDVMGAATMTTNRPAVFKRRTTVAPSQAIRRNKAARTPCIHKPLSECGVPKPEGASVTGGLFYLARGREYPPRARALLLPGERKRCGLEIAAQFHIESAVHPVGAACHSRRIGGEPTRKRLDAVHRIFIETLEVNSRKGIHLSAGVQKRKCDDLLSITAN